MEATWACWTKTAAYTRMRQSLEAQHMNAWIVFHKGQLEGVFADFETAAETALERFDLGPYLIRQVGAGPVQLGGGLTFHPSYAHGARGV